MEQELYLQFFVWFNFCLLPISVKMDWQEGYSVESNQPTLRECRSLVHLKPKIDLTTLFRSSDRKEKLTIKTSFSTLYTEKGCGRDTHDAITLYRNCGIDRIIQLLPIYSLSQEVYVKHIPSELTERGGIDYVFDGGTAVRYPTKRLPTSWFQSYTITAWVLVEVHAQRQYIFSWSDGDTPRKEYTGFYVARRDDGKHINFGFHHTHVDQLTGEECQIKQRWRFHSHNIEWNFLSLSFQKCSVQLTVDGNILSPVSGMLKFHLPEKHIQPKFVIGARWAGSLLKYSDYFHGKISGFMLTPSDVNTEKLACLLACREKLQIASRLPSGIKVTNGVNSLTIEGYSEEKHFSESLGDIVYMNNAQYPVHAERHIAVEVTNQVTKKTTKEKVRVKIQRKEPSIVIQGDCNEHGTSLTTQGIKLCRDINIYMTGCEQVLDSLVVNVKPQMSKKEKVFIAQAYIKRHRLTLVTTETGFVVYGSAMVSQYAELLRHIKYSSSGYIVGESTRIAMISVLGRNGLIKSNDFNISFKSTTSGIVVLPLNGLDNVNAMHAVSSNHIVRAKSKLVASKDNTSTQPYVVWLITACLFSAALVVFMVGYGYRTYKYRGNHYHKKGHEEHEKLVSSEYFWDEGELPMRLTINPSERVSITNDPYVDIILKQPTNGSTSDESVFSDDDETDFDTDSIRQLEWDSLENSLDAILEEERKLNEEKKPRERKMKKDGFNKEIYL
ncbi:calsyntenin-2-like isoform X2 [Hydractinia symbiolongicarpus]|uniref:calsyntenin-2-like isoform X2 n=1 Tax=Hydractinia symbiolongicarpus TaxID=13093 RepID=UPI00254C7D5F|nr:calsyntenin-2-like isoform X2 [Hydractinia symbiolongicarpus]